MKKIMNGFQCEKCKSVYLDVHEAEKCENKLMEQPLVKIGTILNDEYEDAKFKIRISEIYFNGHEVCYRYDIMEGGKWSECTSYYGNEMLLEQLGDQLL